MKIPMPPIQHACPPAAVPLTPVSRRAQANRRPRIKTKTDPILGPMTGSGTSTVGHDGEVMIIQGWRKPVAVSYPFQLDVAKTIHLSGKAVTSASGVRRDKAAFSQWVQGPPGNFRSSRKQSEQSWR